MSASEGAMETGEFEIRATRSSVAAANLDGPASVLKHLRLNTNKFMENFNPETSARERRKLTRKLSAPGSKKGVGVMYDPDGIHLASGEDMCDCLMIACPGCYYPCAKCGSEKCGIECRVNRKYIYDQVDYEGCNISYRNAHSKTVK